MAHVSASGPCNLSHRLNFALLWTDPIPFEIDQAKKLHFVTFRLPSSFLNLLNTKLSFQTTEWHQESAAAPHISVWSINSKTKRKAKPKLIIRTDTDQHHATGHSEVLHLPVTEKETKPRRYPLMMFDLFPSSDESNQKGIRKWNKSDDKSQLQKKKKKRTAKKLSHLPPTRSFLSVRRRKKRNRWNKREKICFVFSSLTKVKQSQNLFWKKEQKKSSLKTIKKQKRSNVFFASSCQLSKRQNPRKWYQKSTQHLCSTGKTKRNFERSRKQMQKKGTFKSKAKQHSLLGQTQTNMIIRPLRGFASSCHWERDETLERPRNDVWFVSIIKRIKAKRNQQMN